MTTPAQDRSSTTPPPPRRSPAGGGPAGGGPAAGWWLPLPALRWAPVSHAATAALITSGNLHDRYQLGAAVLLTLTAQICDTVKSIHTRGSAT